MEGMPDLMAGYVIVPFLALAILAFFGGLTYALFRLFSKFGTEGKAKDAGSRWSQQAKPTIGGFVFLSGFLAGEFFFNHHIHIMGILSGLLAFGLGLWDDVKRIPATHKLLGQLVIAALVVFNGGVLQLVDPMSVLGQCMVNETITIFLIVGMMNSINMLDNMDGVATIAALPLLFSLIFYPHMFPAMMWVFALSLVGFLFFNWPKSKVFMGDAGSMLLGLMLAESLIAVSFDKVSLVHHNGAFVFVELMTVCALYIVDTCVVVIQRLRHGISPAQGGKDHTTHNLVYLGFSEKQVALTFLGLGVIQLIILYTVLHFEPTTPWIYVLPIVYFFALFSTMLWISFRNLKLGKYQYSKK